jgi:hypothetical protein
LHPRRPDGRPDHPRAVTGEDAVERGGELAVPVAYQELEPAGALAEVHEEVARRVWSADGTCPPDHDPWTGVMTGGTFTHRIVSNENEVEDGYLLALNAIEGNRV